MPLPFKAKSLDTVPEAHRGLYKEVDGAFVMDVEGVKTEEDISKLAEALRKEREKNRELTGKKSALSDDEAAELEQLRADKAAADEAKAREAGKFDELRTKLFDLINGHLLPHLYHCACPAMRAL